MDLHQVPLEVNIMQHRNPTTHDDRAILIAGIVLALWLTGLTLGRSTDSFSRWPDFSTFAAK